MIEQREQRIKDALQRLHAASDAVVATEYELVTKTEGKIRKVTAVKLWTVVDTPSGYRTIFASKTADGGFKIHNEGWDSAQRAELNEASELLRKFLQFA